MSDHHGVQVMHHVRTARSVLALVCLDLGGMWELAFVRMKPAAFEMLTTGTHIDEVEVRYLERTSFDEQEVGLELVAEWRASPVWQQALRAAERRTISANAPVPQRTAVNIRRIRV